MGHLLSLSARECGPLSLSHAERVTRLQRHRAVEAILLREFDAVMAELDNAKQDELLPARVRAVCRDYQKVVQKLHKFLSDEVVPAGVSGR